jgi:hypothetical protein
MMLGLAILTSSPFRFGAFGQLGLANSSVFHAGFSCLLAFDVALTVRVSSYFTIPLSANLLNVSSAFIASATSVFENVDLTIS